MEEATPERAARSPARICLLVAVAATLPYLLMPAQPVIYDGQLAIVGNDAVQSGPIGELFGVDFWGEPTTAAHSTRSWRPLVSLSWAIQARLFSDSATFYHLGDLVLHGVASALVVLLLAAWGIDRRWLLPAGLLFALHPLQTDSVASAVGRADVMAGICLFGALVLHLRGGGRKNPLFRRIGTLALLGAGFLCKEYAVAFPFILLAADLTRRASGRTTAEERRGQRLVWIGAFALLAAYLLLRVALFGGLGGAAASPDFHPLAEASLSARWATSFAVIPLALRLLVLPIALNHHYRFGTFAISESLLDLRALWGLALVVALLVAAAYCLFRRRRPTPAFALALFLLPLGPSLHVVSVVNVLFAERFLYIPVAGLALLLAWGLETWAVSPVARKAATAVVAVVLVAFTVMTARRVGDWSSMERLTRASLASYPDGSDVLKQLGVALVQEGRFGEAVQPLQRAVEINPRDSQAWTVYAAALKGTRRFDEASAALKNVIDLAPAPPGLILREAGQIELAAGRAPNAVIPLRRAHEAMPADAQTLYLLAQAHLRSGDPEQAVEVLQEGEEAMATDPGTLGPLLAQAMLRVGQIRLEAGRGKNAVFWARQAIETGELPPAGIFLAGMLGSKAGYREFATAQFDLALTLDPELLRKKHDAALQLTEAGSYAMAIAQLEEILIARPDHAPTLFNLGRSLILAGRPDDAVEPLERGLELQEDATARSLLAQARGAAG